MAFEASVETVLSKITKHNPDVLGCIAATSDAVYSDLPEAYELVDAEGIVEHASNVFKLTSSLDTGHSAFDQLFLEYEGHSFYARQMDDAILVLVNSPIQRGAFKKMQVGVNLFLQPLERALNSPDEPAATKSPGNDRIRRLRRVFGSLV